MTQDNDNRNVEELVDAGAVVDFDALKRKMKFNQLRRRSFEAALREASARVDPTVTIDLLGRTYTLEYSLRTCINLYKEIGKNPGQGQITDEDLDNLDLLPVILWHGLQKHHRGEKDLPTVDDILDLNIRKLAYLRTVVAKALSAILPDEELLKRVELEMQEDPEFRPFVLPSGSIGSSPSEE